MCVLESWSVDICSRLAENRKFLHIPSLLEKFNQHFVIIIESLIHIFPSPRPALEEAEGGVKKIREGCGMWRYEKSVQIWSEETQITQLPLRSLSPNSWPAGNLIRANDLKSESTRTLVWNREPSARDRDHPGHSKPHERSEIKPAEDDELLRALLRW